MKSRTEPHDVPRAGPDLAGLLRASAAGDRAAFDALIPLLYEDLRRLAHRQLDRLATAGTWNTTALVHEAYVRLVAHDGEYRDLPHFLAVSACAMRHIVVDHSRRRLAVKRGGRAIAITLDEEELATDAEAEQVLAIAEVLSRLGELDPRLVQVAECRVFGGYTEEETAAALGIPLRSVQRLWMRARAWLAEEMGR